MSASEALPLRRRLAARWWPGGMPRNVLAAGVVSFFTDVSSEMIVPVLPLFLTGTLGASASVVGLIEGVAESTASLLRVFAGWISDRTGRRKPLILLGYTLSNLAKPLFALATAWPQVLVVRFADRFGKGIRGAPPDALIADSVDPSVRGRAFGFHRSMDTAGALITDLVPASLRATALGTHATATGLALLPASTVAGLLWTAVAPWAPFAYGAATAALAALLLGFLPLRRSADGLD